MPEQQMSVSRFEALRQFNETEAPRAASEVEQEAARVRMMFETPAELLQAPYIVVCSVWPERMVSQAFTHGGVGIKRYTIEAGSPEKPAYMYLQNTYDYIIQQEGIGEKGYGAKTILAAQYAVDILRLWTGDHIGNIAGKKGIGIIKGEPTGDPNNRIRATKKEIDTLTRDQVNFLKFLIDRADSCWDSSDHMLKRKAPTRENRMALDMLGLDPEQHGWYRSKSAIKFQKCPFCAQSMLADAIFCAHCRQEAARFFIERDQTPSVEQWPAVAAEVKRIKALAKKS